MINAKSFVDQIEKRTAHLSELLEEKDKRSILLDEHNALLRKSINQKKWQIEAMKVLEQAQKIIEGPEQRATATSIKIRFILSEIPEVTEPRNEEFNRVAVNPYLDPLLKRMWEIIANYSGKDGKK